MIKHKMSYALLIELVAWLCLLMVDPSTGWSSTAAAPRFACARLSSDTTTCRPAAAVVAGNTWRIVHRRLLACHTGDTLTCLPQRLDLFLAHAYADNYNVRSAVNHNTATATIISSNCVEMLDAEMKSKPAHVNSNSPPPLPPSQYVQYGITGAPPISRSTIAKLCDEGLVSVNNITRQKAYKLKDGDEVSSPLGVLHYYGTTVADDSGCGTGQLLHTRQYLDSGSEYQGLSISTPPSIPASSSSSSSSISTALGARMDSPQPLPPPLDVLFEDDHMLAVNKPSGMIVYPATPTSIHLDSGDDSGDHSSGRVVLPPHRIVDATDSFVSAFLHHIGEKKAGALLQQDSVAAAAAAAGTATTTTPRTRHVKRPGIVHRLDRGTTGVLLAGKTPSAVRELKEIFAARAVDKLYIAICVGNPGNVTLINNIARSPTDRQKMCVVDARKQSEVPSPAATAGFIGRSRTAVSHVRTIACSVNNKLSVVAVSIETGRTHQIRVQLHHIGHPILGDVVYCTKQSLLASKRWRTTTNNNNKVELPIRKKSRVASRKSTMHSSRSDSVDNAEKETLQSNSTSSVYFPPFHSSSSSSSSSSSRNSSASGRSSSSSHSRPFLHAYRVLLPHPIIDGCHLNITAPLPIDMQNVLRHIAATVGRTNNGDGNSVSIFSSPQKDEASSPLLQLLLNGGSTET